MEEWEFVFGEVNRTISGLRTGRIGEKNEDFDVMGVRREGEGVEIGYPANYLLQVGGGCGQIWNTKVCSIAALFSNGNSHPSE